MFPLGEGIYTGFFVARILVIRLRQATKGGLWIPNPDRNLCMILNCRGVPHTRKLPAAFGGLYRFIERQPYFGAEEPQILTEVGTGPLKLVVNVATHGNELLPVIAVHQALPLLESLPLHGSIRFTVANPPALRARKRFIESDLNRIYPGRADGTGEERLAAAMLPLIEQAPLVLDMHTSPHSPAFIVAVTRSAAHLAFAERFDIAPIVHLAMKPEPHSLVQFARVGVGIELGRHDELASIGRGVAAILAAAGHAGVVADAAAPAITHRYYAMTGTISRERAAAMPAGMLTDFHPVANALIGIDPADGVTIPVLCDPHRTYSPYYCCTVREVSREFLQGREV